MPCMPSAVRIRGQGVAASCCARLLQRGGIPFVREIAERPRVPAVMLGETAQILLGDIFERQGLFDGGNRVRKRIVAWGADRRPLEFPHSSVVVSEQTLLERIHSAIEVANDNHATSGAMEPVAQKWTIYASPPLPVASVVHRFGSRLARASSVKLNASVEKDACWTESLDAGWLFLLPCGPNQGWLLSVGGPVDQLLEQSSLVAAQMAEIGAASDEFPCHPRVADPLSDPGWLICGTAAVGFDPLCGDGVGYATREAILASAVIRAAARGADAYALAAHYRTGVLAGFRKHLFACRDFYKQGRRGPWWDRQVSDLECGLVWCAEQLQDAQPIRFRLNGFELQSVE
jgi:hypothetical protein